MFMFFMIWDTSFVFQHKGADMLNEENVFEMLYSKYNVFTLNKKQVAAELQCSVASIDRLRKSGELSSKKVGGMIHFTLEEIARFMCK